MATEDRTASSDLALLLQSVEEAPYRHSLFGLLLRLERLSGGGDSFGNSVRPSEDPVRIAQRASLAFAPAEIAGLARGQDGRPPRLEVYHPGLLGPNGPLPTHLTEHARQRLENEGDPTFSRFLDLFHHRMISLFYRAWANSEPTAGVTRAKDRFALFAGSFIGIGFESLRDRDAWPDAAKLHHAGRLSVHARPPGALREMIADYFEVPVRLREFVGEWLDLPPGQRFRLGESPSTGALGTTTTIGARVWSRADRFRLVLGPLGRKDFERFLPGSETLRTLVALVRNYVGDELRWDLHLILKKQEVPGLRLGVDGAIGRTAWLEYEGRMEDAADAVVDPQPMISR